MKILVTGGAGFIGSHIVDAYVAAGHEVVVLDDLSSGRTENVHREARLVQLDIREKAARELIRQERPDVLNHHAAQMDVRRSVADPRFDADVNLIGFLNVLEGAREAGVGRVIFASSGGAVYGDREELPTTENDPTEPVSPYGVSKRAGELYLHFYHVSHGLPYVALRYANVYGPRQDPHGEAGVVAIFTQRLLSGEQSVINGDGTQTRDYVYVGDVAAANVAALQTDFVGPVNIGLARETDVNQLYELLREAAGVTASATHGPAKAGEQRRSVIDASRARHVLGWVPRTQLADGLREVVAFFRARH
jgi:UDP-glucose 4-epimerase